jgi:hypothetical protein
MEYSQADIEVNCMDDEESDESEVVNCGGRPKGSTYYALAVSKSIVVAATDKVATIFQAEKSLGNKNRICLAGGRLTFIIEEIEVEYKLYL